MKVTSAFANKMIKELNQKKSDLFYKQKDKSVYEISQEGIPVDEKPEYSFDDYQKKIEDIDKRVMEIKHAINVFNSSVEIPEFDNLTVDRVLIYLAQMNSHISSIDSMARAKKKKPVSSGYNSPVVSYLVLNYSIEDVETELDVLRKRVAEAQLALDKTNMTVEFEIPD